MTMTRSAFRPAAVILILAAAAGPLRAQGYTDLDRQRAQLMLDVVRRDLMANYYDSTFGGLPIAAMFDSARAQIGRSQSNTQSFSLIARVFLSLHDSQTLFLPPSRAVTFDYGWDVRCIGDSAYITQVDSTSDAAAKGIRVGDRVLGVDGVVIDRADFLPFSYVLAVLANSCMTSRDSGERETSDISGETWSGRGKPERFTSPM